MAKERLSDENRVTDAGVLETVLELVSEAFVAKEIPAKPAKLLFCALDGKDFVGVVVTDAGNWEFRSTPDETILVPSQKA